MNLWMYVLLKCIPKCLWIEHFMYCCFVCYVSVGYCDCHLNGMSFDCRVSDDDWCLSWIEFYDYWNLCWSCWISNLCFFGEKTCCYSCYVDPNVKWRTTNLILCLSVIVFPSKYVSKVLSHAKTVSGSLFPLK